LVSSKLHTGIFHITNTQQKTWQNHQLKKIKKGIDEGKLELFQAKITLMIIL